MSKHSNVLSGKVESNLNFSPNYVVLRQDLNIIIWIKERFSVFQSGLGGPEDRGGHISCLFPVVTSIVGPLNGIINY